MCQLCAVVNRKSVTKTGTKMDPCSCLQTLFILMQIVFDQNNYNESMARLHLYQF